MERGAKPIVSVVQIGLGPIGLGIARMVLARHDLQLIAAVDIDPAKIGRDVGDLAGVPSCGVTVSPQLDAESCRGATTGIVATSSRIADVAITLERCIQAGMHVVSTCEQLAYPWPTEPELARRIDDHAAARGVVVLGTGVNPGFLMDILPAILTAPCAHVDRIRVERFQDAADRRPPFQAKIGVGLDGDEFDRRRQAGTLGHVGFPESVHLLADSVGLGPVTVAESIEPVFASGRTGWSARSPGTEGAVAGLRQRAVGYRNDEPVVELELQAFVGHPDPRDTVVIRGTPDVTWTAPGGVNGDIGTCAITVNALPIVMSARPGLRTMRDVAPITCGRPPDAGPT